MTRTTQRGMRKDGRWIPIADPEATDQDFNCTIKPQMWYNRDNNKLTVVYGLDKCRFSEKATKLFRLSRGQPKNSKDPQPNETRIEAAKAATVIARTKILELLPTVMASGSYEGGYSIGKAAGLQTLHTKERKQEAVMPKWIYQMECKQAGTEQLWPRSLPYREEKPSFTYIPKEEYPLVRRETLTCRLHGRKEVGLDEECYNIKNKRIEKGKCYPYPKSDKVPATTDEKIRGWIEEQKTLIDGMKEMDKALSQMYDVIESKKDHELMDIQEELKSTATETIESGFGPFKPWMR